MVFVRIFPQPLSNAQHVPRFMLSQLRSSPLGPSESVWRADGLLGETNIPPRSSPGFRCWESADWGIWSWTAQLDPLAVFQIPWRRWDPNMAQKNRFQGYLYRHAKVLQHKALMVCPTKVAASFCLAALGLMLFNGKPTGFTHRGSPTASERLQGATFRIHLP